MSKSGRRIWGGRARLVGAAAICLAAALGASVAQPVAAHAADAAGTVKIMPLGDSITDGLTVPGGYRIELWRTLVANQYSVDFVGSQSNGPTSLGDRNHEGHSGWTISQIDAQINGWLTTYQPDTILLHIGTNDMYQSPSNAPARLGTLIDHITTRLPDAEVFVATIIPFPMMSWTVQTFNAQVPGIVQARADAGKHVHLVDMYPKLTSSDLADGVHPNATGYAKMAAAWHEALLSVPGSLG